MEARVEFASVYDDPRATTERMGTDHVRDMQGNGDCERVGEVMPSYVVVDITELQKRTAVSKAAMRRIALDPATYGLMPGGRVRKPQAWKPSPIQVRVVAGDVCSGMPRFNVKRVG